MSHVSCISVGFAELAVVLSSGVWAALGTTSFYAQAGERAIAVQRLVN